MPIDYEQLLQEAEVHFSRSSGKGGQNINKVETRVELTLNIPASKVLNEQSKKTLIEVLKNKVDHEGTIRVVASSERLQQRNRKLAENKLLRLISAALKPQKKRLKTAPSAASKIARLAFKRRISLKKKSRSSNKE